MTGRGSRRWLAGAGVGAVVALGAGVAGVALVRLLAGGGAVVAPDGPGSGAETGSGSGSGDGVATQERLLDLLEAVQTYVRAERYAEAEAVLGESVAQYVDDQELRLAYAEFLFQRQRLAESYEQFLAALAIGPRLPEIEFNAGVIATTLGEHARALEHFAAAQGGDPTNADYAMYLANEQLRLGLADEGKASLVRVTVLDPQRALPWGTLARIELQANNLVMARQHVAKARELAPREPAWALIEARVVKRDGDADGALTRLLAFDERTRADPEFARTIAESYAMLGESGPAARAYDLAVRAHADDGVVVFAGALWWQRAGDMARARLYAERAAALGNDRAGAWLARVDD